MPFHIRDPETDKLVRTLARREGVGLTEAVRDAVRARLQAREKRETLDRRIQPVVDELARYPDTGLPADKAFFDDLSHD